MLLFIFILLDLVGCSNIAAEKAPTIETHLEKYQQYKQKELVDREEDINEEDKKKILIEKYIQEMTVEEKIGQVFMEAFRYNKNNKPITSLDKEVIVTLETYQLGGIIFFAENIDTIEQTQNLIRAMQEISKIPLFIAIDEEGGLVSRLNSSPNMPATRLPGNKALGDTGDVELAYKIGRLLGRELASLGFNMNLAPVADVNTNPKNPVIGNRSFGRDPYKVGEMVANMARGIQEENISAVVKHFPGHGDTSFDTHERAVTLHHDRDRLESVEFLPFKRSIKEDVDGVMLAHIKVPHLTSKPLPATLSKEIVTDILREDLQHEKLIITDALEMAAIARYWSPGEAAVLAFEAGADILLMPESLEEAYGALLNAVGQGRITEERLNASIKRILTVKHERGVLEAVDRELIPEKVLGSQEHQELIKQIKDSK